MLVDDLLCLGVLLHGVLLLMLLEQHQQQTLLQPASYAHKVEMMLAVTTSAFEEVY